MGSDGAVTFLYIVTVMGKRCQAWVKLVTVFKHIHFSWVVVVHTFNPSPHEIEPGDL